MDQNIVQNILSLVLFFIPLTITIRAFYLYNKTQTRRLFILGLSMLIISLTAVAGFLGDNLTSITLNVDWFNYIGQTVSFLFILLSFFKSSDNYLRNLMRWHFVCSLLLLILLFLAPVLPPEFPDPTITKSVLSGSRGLVCLVIFICYIEAFMKKETRFSFLMSLAFLLISFGYFTIIPKYFAPNDLLDQVGDLLRLSGVFVLLAAVL